MGIEKSATEQFDYPAGNVKNIASSSGVCEKAAASWDTFFSG
jgi:hypothetical protein